VAEQIFNDPRIALNRIYTKGGDKGETALAGGQRVPKDSPRIEAYGTVDEANATIGGHADAVEAVLPEGFKMGFPGLGRAIRGQLDFEDGRTLRLNRDHDRLMAGKHLIAEIKHHGGRCHRKG